jgi:hypothetical protein
MKSRIAALTGILLLAISCRSQRPATGDLPEDPSDPTIAVFRFEDGKPVIRAGRLHSGQFRKLSVGDYPSVSPGGGFVAYNRSLRTGIQPVEVIEIQSGIVRKFDSIPKDLAPWPESFWSKDETLIAFQVHDFTGNKDRCVVSMVDDSFWRGTDAEFRLKYPNAFKTTTLDARSSAEGRLTIENFKHVGALFFRADNGESIRLTPENMGVASSPIWLERTREALFVGRRANPPYDENRVMPGKIYLIKPEARDWANASDQEWEKAIVTDGEQVSCSK